MDKFIIRKDVNTLPSTLTKDTLYCIKSGSGFTLYLTNSSGTLVAYPLNSSPLNILTTNPSTLLDGQQWLLETDVIGTLYYNNIGSTYTNFNKQYELCTAINGTIYKQIIT